MIEFLTFLKESILTKTAKQDNKTYALVGGSFKPPTIGHLDMVKQYSKMADVVIVLISAPSAKSIRKTKTGMVITPEMSKSIWEIYVRAANLHNIDIQISPVPSPIQACFDWVSNDAPINSTIILGSSQKDNDYKRWATAQKYFAEKRPDLTILDPKSVSVKPYASDTNILVSASDIRKNIDNPEYIVGLLPKELSNDDIKNVLGILQGTKKESVISEGGASGHMTNLFEDPNMTFSDLKDIFNQIFSGKIEVTEKTDGIALAVTYKDGQLKAARNKKTLKDPLSIDELDSMFSDRSPNIRKAFVNSMRAMSSAINHLSENEKLYIFNNGQNFMAFEIIDPDAKNVLNYGNQLILQLHGVNIYDEKFNKISEDKEAAKFLYSLLKKYGVQTIDDYKITGPQILKIKKDGSFKQSLAKIKNKLDILQKKYSADTLSEFTEKRFISYVKKQFEQADLPYTDQLIQSIARYFNYLTPEKTKLTDIKKAAKNVGYDINQQQQFLDLLYSIKDNSYALNDKAISPVQNLVIEAGILLLKNLSGFIAMNPDETSQNLANDIQATVDMYNQKPELFNDAKKKIFTKNIKKLIDWKQNISPAEGVVFIYKGKVYKMTGQFGPINQIVNLLRY